MADFSCLQDFNPNDERILAILKEIVVDEKPLGGRHDRIIQRCNLFGNESEPSQIWEHYGRGQSHVEQLFFLSKLKRIGKNISRKIGGNGTWSESGSKEIKGNTNPNLMGRKRSFRFEKKCKSGEHARWLLEEYSLYDTTAPHDNTKASKNRYDFDLVICKMRRNPGGNKRKRWNDPNTNSVEDSQMAETLEAGSMRSVGSACQGEPLQDDPNTNSVEEPQMAETLEAGPMQSVGSACQGEQDHYPLTCPAQMEGNQEEQQPFPIWATACSAWFDREYGGANEANFQILSNHHDTLVNLPFEEGTSNNCSGYPWDLLLWYSLHKEYGSV